MPTIGLVMTTYNEEKVIKRCLESVLPYIDYYSIGVDLKTTDNTKSIIEETLKDKTGVVFDSPWRGFADARNQAFEHFTWDVDWFLVIDADMFLVDEGFDKTSLNKDLTGYLITIRQGKTYWDMNWLVNADYDWHWRGILHEFLDCRDNIQTIEEKLQGLYWEHGGDGGARPKDSAMFKRDADVFLNALVDETDPFMVQRYTFYLANSYRDAGMKKESIIFYRMRAKMGGWEQEVYLSHFYAGRQSNNPHDYLNAIHTLPTRCDALIELIYYGIEKNNFEIINRGLHYYDEAVEENRIWDTEGLFFSDRINDLYDWVSVGMSKVGRIEDSKKLMLKLIDIYTKEEDFNSVERVKNNLSLFPKEGN